MELQGQVAIVTGAGRGIGRATALGLARMGADIVVAELDRTNAEATASELRGLGRRALVVQTDVTSRDDLRAMVEQTRAEFGRIDALVNNAGIYRAATTLDVTEEHWDAVMNINAKAVFFATQAVLPRCFRRRHGEALHPKREPLDTLDRIRRTVGEYNFAGQYQQTPAPLGGGMVKEDWFQRYAANERPESFERIVQSWDTANKATELSDFSVCTTWGIRGKDLFLLDLLRKRLEYPALKRAVREQHSLFNANVVLIEDKASGTQLSVGFLRRVRQCGRTWLRTRRRCPRAGIRRVPR
jgi:NAD(P)-dependent dehydrogenase (short-subunit alcohol dehydrogenase family)